MKLETKEVGALKKLLKIEVPEDVVNSKFNEVLSDINSKIQIPGFRQGKVPVTILEKRFLNEAKEEVLKNLIPEYYEKAVMKAGIMPVSQPAIEDINIARNAPLSFTATVEIKPQFEIENYTGMKLVKKKVNITEEDVDKVLKAMQEFYGELVVWEEDHAAVLGDFVIIDFEGFLEGKPVENGKADGLLVRIGDGVLLRDFEEQLRGRKKGDDFEIKVEIPEGGRMKVPIPGQPLESVAKMAEFKVKIKEIKKKVLPNIDEEFAKDAGSSSIAELRERIKKDLLEGREREAELADKNLLLKRLIDMQAFEVPSTLVSLEIGDMIEGTRQQILQSGKTPEEVGFNPDVAEKEFEQQARNNVKGGLLLEAIADKEGIVVRAEEIEDEVKKIAEGTKKPIDEIKRMLSLQEGVLEDLKARILGKKVLDFVYSKAVFEEEVAIS